jgi:hypothetical protein
MFNMIYDGYTISYLLKNVKPYCFFESRHLTCPHPHFRFGRKPAKPQPQEPNFGGKQLPHKTDRRFLFAAFA